MVFGNVGVGATAQRTLTINNTGTSALAVTGITYPAGFSGAWSGSIPAGSSQNVSVTFAPNAAQPFSGTVTVSSDATSGTGTTSASGTGIAATRIISLSGSLDFGKVAVWSAAQKTLKISNTGTGPLAVTQIVYPAGFSGPWSGSVPPGSSQNVTVTFRPFEVQRVEGTLFVECDATSGTKSADVSGEGMLPEIAVEQPAGTDLTDGAASVNFGSLTVGFSSPAKTFVIKNTGAASLSIAGATMTGGHIDDFTVSPADMAATLAPGASAKFTIVFSPRAAGARSAGIHIYSNDAGESPFDIALTGSAVGVDSHFAVAQTVDTGLPVNVSGTVKSVTGLPAGLKYDPKTGMITGRPTKPGGYTCSIKVCGLDGKIENFPFTVAVDALQSWASGSFTSLLGPPTPATPTLVGLGGYLKLTSSPGGAITGSLVLGSKSYGFRGQIEGAVDSDRGVYPLTARATIVTNSKAHAQDLVLALEFQPESHATAPGLTGSLTYNGAALPLGPGWQHVWNAKNKPAFGNKDRTLNVALRPVGADGPQGAGIATIKLTKSGLANWTAILADGAAATGSFTASPEGGIPFYAPLAYPNGGSASALLETETVGNLLRVVIDPTQTGRWIKRATSDPKKADRVYRAGYDIALNIEGAEYREPDAGQLLFGAGAPPLSLKFRMLGAGVGQALAFAGIATGGSVSLAAELQKGNMLVVTQAGLPVKISPSFAAATGLLKGSITLSDTVGNGKVSRSLAYNGLYIPDLDMPGSSAITGFFLLPELPDEAAGAKKTPIQSGHLGVSP